MTIRRHGDCRHSIFNGESVEKLALEDIPKAYSLVTAAGSDIPSIAGIVEGVNVLFVAGENMLDCSSGDVPNLFRSNS